jgi:hypothetical protein
VFPHRFGSNHGMASSVYQASVFLKDFSVERRKYPVAGEA